MIINLKILILLIKKYKEITPIISGKIIAGIKSI
jgi:hypothetical protein